MNKLALITGASSGIGRATALRLAKENYNIIVTGRRNDRLESLQAEIKSYYDVKVFTAQFDIQQKEAVQEFVNFLNGEWRDVDVLVNNAGLALGKEPFHRGNLHDWDIMIDTNVKGMMYISKLISEIMVGRGKGHILNITSTASTQVYQDGGIYCASKHAALAMSKSMRIDLLPHGIKVSSISPGAVETEFSTVRFKGDTVKAQSTYDGFTPLYANDIADMVAYVVNQPEHVNINDIEVTCLAQANAYYFNKEK